MKVRIFTRFIEGYKRLREEQHPRQREPLSLNVDYLEELAVVREAIAPVIPGIEEKPGMVSYQGDLWAAVCLQGLEILPGTRVIVVGRKDSTLFVEPAVQTWINSEVLAGKCHYSSPSFS